MSAIAIQTRTVALACTLFCLHATHAQQGTPAAPLSGTKLVLLGTGSPPADPDRSGPASAVVVNGTPYLVDFGAAWCGEQKRRWRSAASTRWIP